jgi:hypothetical protein
MAFPHGQSLTQAARSEVSRFVAADLISAHVKTVGFRRWDVKSPPSLIHERRTRVYGSAYDRRGRQSEDPGNKDAAGDVPSHRRNPAGGTHAHDGTCNRMRG